jgi:ABC-type antimicrobial peptide transport system ATPase subunit
MKLKDPQSLLKAYPYMLSGGMLQRMMIALALAICFPTLVEGSNARVPCCIIIAISLPRILRSCFSVIVFKF